MSKNSGNVLEAIDTLSTEIHNAVKENQNRKSTSKNKRNKNDQNKIVAAIVEMIKNVFGLELSDREEKVIVKHFSRSTTEDMKTYIQPSLKRDPDLVIINVGTNDLGSSQDPETIAKNIIDIAKNSTTNKNEILVSSIVPRRDNLNGKSCQVNNILQKLCVEINFVNVNHGNINPQQH